MKQSVSHYVMPDEKEENTAELVYRLGLDGIENLVYGSEPAANPFSSLTVGAHLRFWPTWMDFYLGRKERYRKQFPDKESLIAYYGACDRDGWLMEIRKNIRAALAEKPDYLVWHVADCTLEEAWTRRFRYTSEDVLRETAKIYNSVADEVPPTVEVLFENIFWPGLCRLLPEEIDYFFSLLKGKNTGLVLDTGHFMNTNPDLETEADGADYICGMAEIWGSLKKLFRGMHLSCSLSGAYQKSCSRIPPAIMDERTVMKHITSIDRHSPFTTDAARKIVDAIEPEYLTHELFGDFGEISEEKLKIQQNALGK